MPPCTFSPPRTAAADGACAPSSPLAMVSAESRTSSLMMISRSHVVADDDQPFARGLDKFFEVVVGRAGVQELRQRCFSALICQVKTQILLVPERSQAGPHGKDRTQSSRLDSRGGARRWAHTELGRIAQRPDQPPGLHSRSRRCRNGSGVPGTVHASRKHTRGRSAVGRMVACSPQAQPLPDQAQVRRALPFEHQAVGRREPMRAGPLVRRRCRCRRLDAHQHPRRFRPEQPLTTASDRER